MKTYKIIFARDEILDCNETNHILPEHKDLVFEQDKGHLIYAFIRAANKTEAYIKAANLLADIYTSYNGRISRSA